MITKRVAMPLGMRPVTGMNKSLPLRITSNEENTNAGTGLLVY